MPVNQCSIAGEMKYMRIDAMSVMYRHCAVFFHLPATEPIAEFTQ